MNKNEDLSLSQFLSVAFEQRQSRNKSYSLRAFSRDLGLAPANLSRAINGKRGLSSGSIEKVSQYLGLTNSEKEMLLLLNNKQFSNSTEKSLKAKNALKTMLLYKNKIEDDKFSVISEWYHFGILALMDQNNFKSKYQWIADQLGLHINTVKQAINRLITVGAVEKKRNKLISTGNLFIDPKGIPSSKVKEFHHQILKLADNAIDFQGLDMRDLNSILFCFDVDRMKEAKEKIRKFREEFELEFGPAPNAKNQEVYALSMQLFQLSSVNKNIKTNGV